LPSLLGLQVSYLVANLCVVDKSKNKQFLGIFGIGGRGGKGFNSMYGVKSMPYIGNRFYSKAEIKKIEKYLGQTEEEGYVYDEDDESD
jgi:hypothetical protein